MRLKAEWEMDEESSEENDSQGSDDDVLDKGTLLESITAKQSGAPSGDEKDIIQDSKVNFVVEQEESHGGSDSDIVEEYVLSDDEDKPSRKQGSKDKVQRKQNKGQKASKGRTGKNRGGKRSFSRDASHKPFAGGQKRKKISGK